MRPLVDLVLVAAFLVLFALAVRTDPRRWRTGVLLLGALWAATTAVGASPLVLPWVGAVLLGLLFLGNGLRVVRPEGRSRTNALALVLGVAMVTATVLAIWLFPPSPTLPAVVGVVVLLLPGYPGLVLVTYALYCLAYLRRRPRPGPAAIIVLGSGLVNGTVPTLLAHRLDAALEAWHDERALGHDPLVVPSGGQGDDEPMAEGVAMTAYLVAHGIPPEARRDGGPVDDDGGEPAALARDPPRPWARRGGPPPGRDEQLPRRPGGAADAQPRHRRGRDRRRRPRGTSCPARSCASSSPR